MTEAQCAMLDRLAGGARIRTVHADTGPVSANWCLKSGGQASLETLGDLARLGYVAIVKEWRPERVLGLVREWAMTEKGAGVVRYEDLSVCLCCERQGKITHLVSVAYRPYNHGTQMQMVAELRQETPLCERHRKLLRTCLLREGATVAGLPGRELVAPIGEEAGGGV